MSRPPIRTRACTRKPRAGSQAGVSRACAHGESSRLDHRRARDARHGDGGARGGRGDDCRFADTHRVTVGGDKNYDTKGFVHQLRTMGVTPHVAQYPETATRGSAIDARTTRHPGYAVSQQKRKLVEQCFGWMKTVGLMRKLRHRGGARSTGTSSSPPRRLTWSGCAHCWPSQPDGTTAWVPRATSDAAVIIG